MAWVVLLAAAAAVLAVGVAATAILLGRIGGYPVPSGSRFWTGLFGACVLTVVSISLRSLRWIFLLRRAETRIPIRDAYIGYLSGLSLLFAPLLAGEMAVRAYVHRVRGSVPVATTLVVNVWERLLDLTALTILAAITGVTTERELSLWSWLLVVCAGLSLVTPVRRLTLKLVAFACEGISSAFDGGGGTVAVTRLSEPRTWSAGLAASAAAWLLPAAGLWLLSQTPERSMSAVDAVYTYSTSGTASVLSFAPGGILVAGQNMLSALGSHGYSDSASVLIVLGVRLATAGLSVALGILFVIIHVRTSAGDSATHFDDIADAYDVQIPESRRYALLDRKTALMKAALQARLPGGLGLDVGCGQGAYVARMRELGFDVLGIDTSAGQVQRAARNVGADSMVRVGSVLDIPAADNTFDFVYIINVLHHLGSVAEQRRAFAELLRVLKPGGLLFVHEINTRNVLFRFYMGYVFPSLNCIDEGVERWLLAHELGDYTNAALLDVRYFTFLPDFVPAPVVRLLSPVEQWLERSAARVYSAHYMAVLQK
jgi:SAM-dependent methyltransferase/uncharacterized membrane protein YbhN (UPF0104 family)